MCKKSVRFRGEASHYLCWPKTTRIALSPLGSNVSVAELQLEGVRPEDLDGKTIVIDVELSRLSGLKTQVLRREDLTEEEWTKICQREFTVSYRDQFD